MPSDLDYAAMAYARDPVKYAHLKPQIDAAVREEVEDSKKLWRKTNMPEDNGDPLNPASTAYCAAMDVTGEVEPYQSLPDPGVRLGSVGIRLDDGDGCIQLLGGGNAIYLHGSTDAMRKFAGRIVAGADYKDKHPKEDEPIEITKPGA